MYWSNKGSPKRTRYKLPMNPIISTLCRETTWRMNPSHEGPIIRCTFSCEFVFMTEIFKYPMIVQKCHSLTRQSLEGHVRWAVFVDACFSERERAYGDNAAATLVFLPGNLTGRSNLQICYIPDLLWQGRRNSNALAMQPCMFLV